MDRKLLGRDQAANESEHMSITKIHPDAEALADHMCGYASACVADAVIEYLRRIDCSPDCRDMIRGGTFQNGKDHTPDHTPDNTPTDGRVCDCEDAPFCGHYEL